MIVIITGIYAAPGPNERETVRPGQRRFRTRAYVPKPSDRGRGMVVLVLLQVFSNSY